MLDFALIGLLMLVLLRAGAAFEEEVNEDERKKDLKLLFLFIFNDANVILELLTILPLWLEAKG